MGKSKSARKGKKAWRKISTEEFDDFNAKTTKDAFSGGPLDSVPSESLFYVDKFTDAPLKRKIEKKREKVLRYERSLQKNPFVKAMPSSTLNKRRMTLKIPTNSDAASDASSKKDPGTFDLWADEGEGDIKGKKKGAVSSAIPAVEVEPPGCSFNPEPESHKDSLAHAVADEMKKIYKSELGPQSIPLVARGEAINEEERYFLDADDMSEDEEEEQDHTEDADNLSERRPNKTKRVTRVVFNRRERRKEVLKKEEEVKKKKQLLKEIDSIPEMMKEIAQEEEEKEKRRLRRVVAKQERLKSFPPRLGKRKFEPAPVQVHLSEEISGSLRKLKGCNTLARDRFKSLEKRGLIVPTLKKKRF